jgi:hypothetical protein
MQPSLVAPGEGLLRESLQRGISNLHACKVVVKAKSGGNFKFLPCKKSAQS